jgi:hypothetical protein
MFLTGKRNRRAGKVTSVWVEALKDVRVPETYRVLNGEHALMAYNHGLYEEAQARGVLTSEISQQTRETRAIYEAAEARTRRYVRDGDEMDLIRIGHISRSFLRALIKQKQMLTAALA